MGGDIGVCWILVSAGLKRYMGSVIHLLNVECSCVLGPVA